MGEILYDCDGVHFNQAEKMNVFYWWASLKEYFSRLFPNFFVPASAPEDGNLLGNPKWRLQRNDGVWKLAYRGNAVITIR